MFPTTRHTALGGVRSSDEAVRRRSWDVLVAVYWKPVYKYLRLRHSLDADGAQDATQGFFLQALDKDFFASFDARRGRFRTFLRTCVDAFAANQRKAAGRVKRGGSVEHLPLRYETAEGELAGVELRSVDDVERYFEEEGIRSLMEVAVEELRRASAGSGKEDAFRIFEARDLEAPDPPPSYADLATTFGLPVTTVNNHLAWARRELRRILLEKMQSLATTDGELRRESRLVLGR